MGDSVKGLRRLTSAQLLNFCLGFFGLQFAWQMRIILSGPVTEELGASPFIFGLIWLAGPVTGMVVQPIIGALSDHTYTKFGRRRPYLILGAVLAAIALWAFPNSEPIAQFIADKLHIPMPAIAGLLVAAVMIAVAYFMVYALLAWGPWNIVRGVTGRYVDSPLHDGALCILAIGIGVTSMVYGYSADHYRSDTDVVKGMSYMFSRFPSYLVSLFFVIQFMVAFEYSGFPVCFGMTECLVDITYWICCLIPLFWEFYYKS